MLTLKEIKQLAIYAAKNEAPANYSTETVGEALADSLRGMASSINEFMKNRYDIYDIIIAAADEVTPNRVIDSLGIFAEVQVVPQGSKAVFRRKLGKQRAKQFLTQVGLSGVYETFRLDSTEFELTPKAVGGAVAIDFERMLDDADSMSELMEVIVDGMVDSTFVEVHKALRAAINAQGRPAANKVEANTFDGDEMFKLGSVVKSYGTGAVIFAPPEFVGAMGPDAIVPVGTSGNYGGVYHPQDIDRVHNQGYINIFRGMPVIQIPQSYIDENNEKTWIDPQLAYIFPTGKEKIVKVAIEGQTQINDFKNRDNSMEIHAYKKIGVAILTHHNWAIYKNGGIPQTYESPYGI